MYTLSAYRFEDNLANIKPLSVKREWMDNTWDAHAYHCFPVSLANKLGWEISFPEDISFIWDGISDSDGNHVKILEGNKYAYADRANATISFHTGIKFVTNENITILTTPPPNYFNDAFQTFTTLVSSSLYHGELPIACMITKSNEIITIKANTPIASILPLDLESIQNSSIIFNPLSEMKSKNIDIDEYSNKMYEINQSGKWSNYYRNGTDHEGNILGKHQVKSIKLNVIDKI